MFIDLMGDGRWPSAHSADWFTAKTAVNGDGRTPPAVITYRRPETLLVDAVVQEFAQSHRGYGVRVVVVGVQEPRLAERLYRERGLPVNVVFGVPEVDGRWLEALGPLRGVTMTGWGRPRPTFGNDDDDENEEDVVAFVVNAFDVLSNDYRSYTAGLRDVPSFAAHYDPSSSADSAAVYAAIMDTFGDGVQSVEPVLDAMLEQLCGPAGNTRCVELLFLMPYKTLKSVHKNELSCPNSSKKCVLNLFIFNNFNVNKL